MVADSAPTVELEVPACKGPGCEAFDDIMRIIDGEDADARDINDMCLRYLNGSGLTAELLKNACGMAIHEGRLHKALDDAVAGLEDATKHLANPPQQQE
jgi:hypothetical protein